MRFFLIACILFFATESLLIKKAEAVESSVKKLEEALVTALVVTYQGVKSNLDVEETEAEARNDTIKSSDLCCDREYTSDSAQEPSQYESQRIVDRILYKGETSPPPVPRSRPSPGQR